LAVEYAHRHRSQFDTVWRVRAEQPATLVGDYADLAGALHLPGVGQADQQLALLAVRRWLEEHDRWLLVLDNAEGPDTSTGLQAPLARLVDLLPRAARTAAGHLPGCQLGGTWRPGGAGGLHPH